VRRAADASQYDTGVARSASGGALV